MPQRRTAARLLSTATSPLRPPPRPHNRTDHPASLLLHARCVETDSSPPPASFDDSSIQRKLSNSAPTPWSPKAPKPLRRMRGKSRWPDRIVAGDLAATLEAHRAANRASIVRPVFPEMRHLDVDVPATSRLNKAVDAGSQSMRSSRTEKAPPIKLTKGGPRSSPSLDALIERLSNKQALSDEDVNAVITFLSEHKQPVLARPAPIPGLLSPLWSWTDVANFQKAAQPWRLDSCPWLEGYIAPDLATSDELCEHELRAFAKWIQPNADEEEQATDVFDAVANVVKEHIPTVNVDLHGSRATGLADACTDIDIAITHQMFDKHPDAKGPNATHPLSRSLATHALIKLEHLFKTDDRFADVQRVPYARIPILILRHKASDLRIEISANSSFKAVREMTRYCMHQFPYARPIYLLLRQALIMRGLYGALDGGMSGYPLFMMVVAALDSRFTPPQNLGAALRQVLHVWTSYNTRTLGYTVMPMRAFSKWDEKMARSEWTRFKRDEAQLDGIRFLIRQNLQKLRNLGYPRWHEGMLTLQDPANPENDLGRKCYRIDEIRATWHLLKNHHLDKVAILDSGGQLISKHKPVRPQSLLDTFVAGRWDSFTMRRDRLQRNPAVSGSKTEGPKPEPPPSTVGSIHPQNLTNDASHNNQKGPSIVRRALSRF